MSIGIRLEGDANDNSGTMTLVGMPGDLEALQELRSQLLERQPDFHDNGTLIILADSPTQD